jgi:hypothetical protein
MEVITQVVVEMEPVTDILENTRPVGVTIPHLLPLWVTLHLTIFHRGEITPERRHTERPVEVWSNTNRNHPLAVISSIIHLHLFHFIHHLLILTRFLTHPFNTG